MIKSVGVLFPFLLMIGSLSAQAKEVELFCYTLKGHPHGINFLINTDEKKVFEAKEHIKIKPEREYEILSWSSDRIMFNDPPNSIRKIIGYMSYSINRINLDFYWYNFEKDGRLKEQLFGKCEIARTKPQF